MSNAAQGQSRSWQSVTRGEALGGWLQQVSTMPLLRDVANRSMDLLALKWGEHVLEVGCGSGVFVPLVAEAVGESGRVIGLDRAPAFVEQARQRTHQTKWIQVDDGDAYALPYADQSFDAAHCDRVLMHVDDPSAVLAEMRRVVRPGGRVVVAEPDWASIVIDSADHDAMESLIRQANTVRRQPYVGRELNRRMAAVGLIDRQIETNILRAGLHPHGMAARVVNFGEVRAHLRACLKHQAVANRRRGVGETVCGAARVSRAAGLPGSVGAWAG